MISPNTAKHTFCRYCGIHPFDVPRSDPDAEKLWAAEAQQRADELASGKVKGIPAETVLTKARAALR